MKTFKEKLGMLALAVTLMGGGAFVQEVYAGGDKAKRAEAGHKKMDKQAKLAKKSREVSGTVINTKNVRLPSEGQENLVVMIKTAKANDRLVVDLGNAKALEKANINEQTKIEAEGRMVRLGSREFLVARNLKVNGKDVEIDRSGQQREPTQGGGES